MSHQYNCTQSSNLNISYSQWCEFLPLLWSSVIKWWVIVFDFCKLYFLFSCLHNFSPLCILLFCKDKKAPSLYCACIRDEGWVWGSVWLGELVRWWFGLQMETTKGGLGGRMMPWCPGKECSGRTAWTICQQKHACTYSARLQVPVQNFVVGRISLRFTQDPAICTAINWWPSWWHPLEYHYPSKTISFVLVSFSVKPTLLWKCLFWKCRLSFLL